mgnify:FL=1
MMMIMKKMKQNMKTKKTVFSLITMSMIAMLLNNAVVVAEEVSGGANSLVLCAIVFLFLLLNCDYVHDCDHDHDYDYDHDYDDENKTSLSSH